MKTDLQVRKNVACLLVVLLNLTLKARRKKMHLKMSSSEVDICKELPNITDELSIEANIVDPEQTAV